MKKNLLCFAIFYSIIASAQIPTDKLLARYDFSGSNILADASNFGIPLSTNTPSSQSATFDSRNQISDRFGNANSAIKMISSFLYRDNFFFRGADVNTFDISYSFWVKTTTNTSWNKTLLDFSTRGTTNNESFDSDDTGHFISLENGVIKFSSRFYIAATANSAKTAVGYSQTGTTTIADGNWHHIVVIFSSERPSTNINMSSKIYVDGVPQTNSSNFNTAIIRDSPIERERLTIADRQNNPFPFQTYEYADDIDDILIYDKALTPSEIGNILTDGITPKIIYVNTTATGANDGKTWTDAYTDLKVALNNAVSKDSIWIAKGRYTPSPQFKNESFNVNTSNLKIFGGFNGTETNFSQRDFRSNKTILSGDLNGNDDNNLEYVNTTRDDNSYTVMSLGASANNLLLDGLTISDGHADNNNAEIRRRSAALAIDDNIYNLEINNCRFEKNVAIEGGGISFWKYSNTNGGYLKINNTVFSKNLATFGATFYIYTNAANTLDITISNSLFVNNITKNTATRNGNHGSAGWYRANASGSTLNTTFINNTFAFNEDKSVRSGWDANNVALIGLGEANGTNATSKLVNNIFFSNVTQQIGSPTNNSNTIIIGKGNVDNDAQITLKSNSKDAIFNGLPSGTLVPTSNKIELPNFNYSTNPTIGYYTLKASSPMINTGENTDVIGTTDLDGNLRIQNTTVDRGAYESNFATASVSNTNKIEFSLFPNPTDGEIVIQTTSTIKKIEIYNLIGKKIMATFDKKINVSHLSTGIYLLKLETKEGKIGIQKIIKK